MALMLVVLDSMMGLLTPLSMAQYLRIVLGGATGQALKTSMN